MAKTILDYITDIIENPTIWVDVPQQTTQQQARAFMDEYRFNPGKIDKHPRKKRRGNRRFSIGPEPSTKRGARRHMNRDPVETLHAQFVWGDITQASHDAQVKQLSKKS